MSINTAPIIKLEVEQLKQTILSMLDIEGSNLGEMLGDEITKSIESYPWERQVENIVHEKIDTLISEYFRYGAGNKMVNEIIDSGFREVLRKQDKE